MPNPAKLVGDVGLEAELEARIQVVVKREKAADQREEELGRRESTFAERERRFEKRELELREREREMALRERESELQRKLEISKQGASKAGHKGDPIHDVPALLSAYRLSGGSLPPGLLVAEVEALQQAATTITEKAKAAEIQIEQLEKKLTLHLSPFRLPACRAALASLRDEKEKALVAAESLLTNFKRLRDEGIQRYVPLLLRSVDHFSRCAASRMIARALSGVGGHWGLCTV